MRITLWIPDETEEWLRDKAAQEIRSISNYIHILIEKERQKDEAEEPATK